MRGLLNQHPDVRCEGEILAEPVDDPVGFVLEHARTCGAPAYGFKVKIYQLTDAQQCDAGDFLLALHHHGFRILYLRRRNLLRHAISNAFAEQRGRYHDSVGGPASRPPVAVDAGAIVRAMRRRREHLAAEARALHGLTHHEVVYEEDLLHASDHQRTMNRVFEFLGLVPVEVEAGLARSVSGSLVDHIVNYEDLVPALERARLAEFLDDPAYETTQER